MNQSSKIGFISWKKPENKDFTNRDQNMAIAHLKLEKAHLLEPLVPFASLADDRGSDHVLAIAGGVEARVLRNHPLMKEARSLSLSRELLLQLSRNKMDHHQIKR